MSHLAGKARWLTRDELFKRKGGGGSFLGGKKRTENGFIRRGGMGFNAEVAFCAFGFLRPTR
jgi:hypothetical protein